jgi:hypothetical protein
MFDMTEAAVGLQDRAAIQTQRVEGVPDASLHRQAHVLQPIVHDGSGLTQGVQSIGHARLNEGATVHQGAVEVPGDEFQKTSRPPLCQRSSRRQVQGLDEGGLGGLTKFLYDGGWNR